MKKQLPNWKKEKILIADDDVYSYLLLKKVLEKSRAPVVYASNGQEAVDIILNDPTITIAVIDIVMPKLSGIEVLKRTKKTRPGLIYIAYTADVVNMGNLHCSETGFYRCIVKPALPVRMLKIITEAINERKVTINR